MKKKKVSYLPINEHTKPYDLRTWRHDWRANPKTEVSLFCWCCQKWIVFKKEQKPKICKCGNDKLQTSDEYIKTIENEENN